MDRLIELLVSRGVILAISGLVSGIAVTLFGVWLKQHFDLKSKKQDYIRLLYLYVEPLASSSVGLLWRFDELLIHKRGEYLMQPIPRTEFEDYKVKSTFYRLVKLISWIHAFKMERSNLAIRQMKMLTGIEESFLKLESALADGHKAEREYLERILNIAGKHLPSNRAEWEAAAYSITIILKKHIEANKVDFIDELEEDKQKECLEDCFNDLISKGLLDELPKPDMKSLTLESLRFREAYIFRDWQEAIASLFLIKLQNENKMYDVKSYIEFESFYDNPNEENKWVERIKRLLLGVNVLNPDSWDYRYDQIREITKATTAIVITLQKTFKNEKVIDDKAFELAQSIEKNLAQTKLGG
ncbi:MAG: hypothetical protein P9X24_16175 [Candidatus Hatepunaea meridiana]|nr:hypothetical protein [Candidatus Hatepunaea meridiana]